MVLSQNKLKSNQIKKVSVKKVVIKVQLIFRKLRLQMYPYSNIEVVAVKGHWIQSYKIYFI
jgi:hypothetical protein